MKISFRREGTALLVKLTIWVPTHGDITYTAKMETGDQYYAGFVHGAVTEQFGENLAEFRKAAYADGWKHAKSKKTPKLTWFSRHWP